MRGSGQKEGLGSQGRRQMIQDYLIDMRPLIPLLVILRQLAEMAKTGTVTKSRQANPNGPTAEQRAQVGVLSPVRSRTL